MRMLNILREHKILLTFSTARIGPWSSAIDQKSPPSQQPMVPCLHPIAYGTTPYSGVGSQGAIFRMTPGGALTRLVSVQGNRDGSRPLGRTGGGNQRKSLWNN